MKVHQDFKELAELLNENKVEYVIVGGYALAFHGHPRYTGDIDILINPTDNNAEKLLNCLYQFGFGGLQLTQADFNAPGNVIQLGIPPVRIDLLTSIDGVSWQEISMHKVSGRLDDIPVFFISKEDLIKNKQTTGRNQDLADIDALTGK